MSAKKRVVGPAKGQFRIVKKKTIRSRRKTQSSARYGIFVCVTFNPSARLRSRVFPKTYQSQKRAMKVVADHEEYYVRLLRGREK